MFTGQLSHKCNIMSHKCEVVNIKVAKTLLGLQYDNVLTEKTLTKHLRKAAIEVHSDENSDPGAVEAMQLVNQTYEMLSATIQHL
jgi:hypothetical protein